jgi:GDP-4-dehydro-6-deoxy-D-mannose reductase
MRVLVTGASGFVGRHLVRLLAAEGDHVIGTDRSEGGPDLLDATRLDALIADADVEALYHLAGQADVAASWKDPAQTFRVNAEGTLNVLESCRLHGVGRVLVVTSAEVYGLVEPGELPITEYRPLAPTSPYAASKAAAEMVCSQYAAGGLAVLRARAFNHLGPGQSERFVAPALAARVLRAAESGARSITVGRLDTRRDFTDVRDVVKAYRSLVVAGTPGEAYNVCSGVDVAISEIVDKVMDEVGHRVTLEADPALQRPSDLPVLRGDNTKLTEATGWQPLISLGTTVADIVASLRAPLEPT